jgi:hypothetical protein
MRKDGDVSFLGSVRKEREGAGLLLGSARPGKVHLDAVFSEGSGERGYAWNEK